jgi:2-oxoglutarate ferredoxin oxidoreductase subunit delta
MEKVKGIHIQIDYCKGCGYCIDVCPKKVLKKSDELTRKGFYPPVPEAPERCTACHACEDICPDFAIYVEENKDGGIQDE